MPLPAPKTSAWFIGSLMHILHFFVRVSQVRATLDSDLGWEDLYWERNQQSWFDWTVPTTCMLLIASTLNALHLFSQTRTYQLHRRTRADPVNSVHTTFVPSPQRDAQVVSGVRAPRSTFAGRIAGLLRYMLLVLWRLVVSVVCFLLGLSSASPSTSSPPKGAPAEAVQQLEMWIPGELERTLLGVYSPVHALLWMCTGSTNWVVMCVVMCVVGVQTGTLISAYEGLVKDKAILAAEVMHEYNEGFVYPRMNPVRRDVAVMTHESEMLSDRLSLTLVLSKRSSSDPSMAPFNLNGLNVVQPVQHDTHDLAAPFPDFSAHLDLWTNLPFESDEPSASSNKPKRRLTDDGDDDDDTPPLALSNQDSHQNAVLPPTAPPPLDVNALLAGFGIDPLLIPAAPPPPVQRSIPPLANPVSSLAQLLTLHAAQTGPYPVPYPPSDAAAPSTAVASPSLPPPSKRSRVQKSLPRNRLSPNPLSTPPSAAEDKRRRNTAASARFRLKKKEREAALERRAKELEERVLELERECEGLRRENGWLKGLVVGVTGAGAAQHQQASTK
ncbi:hypothetical protein J3R83DRAFT_2027 [Lanmaoa asiatica]|nr:hypothetical protein J3R83DRAFT_2027 [Lanmaoa asiatica]